jgi:hypothetical protein
MLIGNGKLAGLPVLKTKGIKKNPRKMVKK